MMHYEQISERKPFSKFESREPRYETQTGSKFMATTYRTLNIHGSRIMYPVLPVKLKSKDCEIVTNAVLDT